MALRLKTFKGAGWNTTSNNRWSDSFLVPSVTSGESLSEVGEKRGLWLPWVAWMQTLRGQSFQWQWLNRSLSGLKANCSSLGNCHKNACDWNRQYRATGASTATWSQRCLTGRGLPSPVTAIGLFPGLGKEPHSNSWYMLLIKVSEDTLRN